MTEEGDPIKSDQISLDRLVIPKADGYLTSYMLSKFRI